MVMRRMILVLTIVAMLAGLSYVTAAWAAPSQNPDRQTVPTKTPVPATKQPKEGHTPTPTVAATVAPTTSAPQVLPRSGSESTGMPLLVAGAGLLLLLGGWAARKRASG